MIGCNETKKSYQVGEEVAKASNQAAFEAVLWYSCAEVLHCEARRLGWLTIDSL